MNWGTKLLIGMGLFMAFIVTLGIVMVMNNDDTLIEENYYEKGLNYDKDYKEKQSAVLDSVVPEFNVTNNGLSIQFSAPVYYTLICKRLANSKMDQEFKGVSDESGSVKLSKGALAAGPWKLELEYIIENKQYKVERDLVMP